MALMDTPAALILVAGFYFWVRAHPLERSESKRPEPEHGILEMPRFWLLLCGATLGLAFATRGLCAFVIPIPLLILCRLKRGERAAFYSPGSRFLCGLAAVLTLYVLLWAAPHRAELAQSNAFYLKNQQLLPSEFWAFRSHPNALIFRRYAGACARADSSHARTVRAGAGGRLVAVSQRSAKQRSAFRKFSVSGRVAAVRHPDSIRRRWLCSLPVLYPVFSGPCRRRGVGLPAPAGNRSVSFSLKPDSRGISEVFLPTIFFFFFGLSTACPGNRLRRNADSMRRADVSGSCQCEAKRNFCTLPTPDTRHPIPYPYFPDAVDCDKWTLASGLAEASGALRSATRNNG